MSIYQRALTVNFGPTRSGLANDLTFTVTSPDGNSVYVAETSDGISEIYAGTGAYKVVLDTANTEWGFALVFWRGPNGMSSPESVDFGNVAHNSTGGGGSGGGTLQGSFDPALPTKKDEVRARVGDISSVPQWFIDDATILAYLARYTFAETCARSAEAIAAECIQMATRVEQRNLKLQYEGRAAQYFELADRIRNDADPEAGEPIRTGAASAPLLGPDLSNYMTSLGLPVGDPNNPYGSY